VRADGGSLSSVSSGRSTRLRTAEFTGDYRAPTGRLPARRRVVGVNHLEEEPMPSFRRLTVTAAAAVAIRPRHPAVH
jgi:hypothetical protein